MKKTERKKLTDGREVEIVSYSNGEMEIFEVKANGQRIDLVESDEFETLQEGLHYVHLHAESDNAGAKVHLEKLLKDSKLPDVAKDKLRKQFETSEGTDGMKEAIEDEVKYLAKVAPGRVHGMGASEDAAAVARFEKRKERFQRSGLTEPEADLAAVGHDPDPRKLTRKQRFMKGGLTEAEAEIAADFRR